LDFSADSYVLVVEDDVAIRASLLEVLACEGLSARAAGNGLEAFRTMAGHGPPALILLDLMMPEMDGATFLRYKRADPALAGIPVVVMTASEQRDLTHLQADARLRKPFTLKQLFSALEPWVARQAG
jgi:CheY-like chemotaxis protein